MVNLTPAIHEFLSRISCIFLVFFVGGVACLITGIRILWQKKVILSAPKPSIFDWHEPIKLKGARSKFHGIYYIVFGSVLLLLCLLMFVES